MKNDENYIYYVYYLKDKMKEGLINKGTFSLMLISESSFNNFKDRFENDDTFKNKMVDLHLIELRNFKINKILKNNI